MHHLADKRMICASTGNCEQFRAQNLCYLGIRVDAQIVGVVPDRIFCNRKGLCSMFGPGSKLQLEGSVGAATLMRGLVLLFLQEIFGPGGHVVALVV